MVRQLHSWLEISKGRSIASFVFECKGLQNEYYRNSSECRKRLCPCVEPCIVSSDPQGRHKIGLLQPVTVLTADVLPKVLHLHVETTENPAEVAI